MVRLTAVALALAATFMTVAASADSPQYGTVQHLEQRQEDAKQKEKEELTQLFLEYAKTTESMTELMKKLAGK
ncbi:hypothetical protein VFPPC_10692 [Pochonia chlamydosporia 170]|uniref:Uncharacterized protein n=1 Tax=Pochonia chlamydosporia 170 TaxID=1380566 RepID=A0A179F581_METCM|nr:hypothetical protein VFPPC_10692 [Pochonia chlamydosporia 170]OAQ60269.1 hypothetical protein VFPPC_10692 [Pochonia chlamydosporia 170]